ncbi:MAG TPA: NAD(P)-binding domain-containing protein, partial [Flavisolibacter sp.]|nr:NAD(P)-binding domain-containing protein [Flavisolibacter sp.]
DQIHLHMKYIIIGAGPCGLAMAKALKDVGISYDHVEADEILGGNWAHGVYKTVYTDTCKDVMQYEGFPFPEDTPPFLSQAHMLEYLNQFATAYDLHKKIRFGTKVVWVEAIENNLWRVHFQNQLSEIYKGVIVCNGHHWDKQFPNLPGSFSGELMHAKDYKEPRQLQDKKVLVIGSGNSAADIVCESARVSKLSVLALNDSPWIFPKTIMGIPLGRLKVKNYPNFITAILVRLLLRISFGKHSYYNLEKPNHKPFEKHPTVSEELPYYLKHGRIMVKKGINNVSDRVVTFADDSSIDFDLVVAATGYKLSFPFLPPSLVRTENKNLLCIGHCVYPDYKGLFFMGWQQVRGGVGSLASAFSKAIVDLISIEEESGLPSGLVLQEMKNTLSVTNLYSSKELYQWTKKHNYKTLSKVAKKLRNRYDHLNLPTPEKMPDSNLVMQVF